MQLLIFKDLFITYNIQQINILRQLKNGFPLSWECTTPTNPYQAVQSQISRNTFLNNPFGYLVCHLRPPYHP